MKLRIGPINAATPTPLRADGSFDRESARRLCARWLEAGLDGVLLLGSMGEGLLLPEDVRTAFVETALEEAGNKLTLFVSAASRDAATMRERAARYAAMGAHCVVLSAPVGAGCGETVEQVRRTADACPVPCAYYEVPIVSKVALYVREIHRILSHPNICAFKDSSGNSLIAQALTSDEFRTDVKLLDGVEYHVCYSVAMGYDGVIHGGGVMTGRRVRSIWSKACAGNSAEALALDRENSLCLGHIYNRFAGPVQNIAGQKFALKLLGLLADERVMVDQTLDDCSRERIARAVEANRHWLAGEGPGCGTVERVISA
jgi:4-hydroxy-tetrahydrodipicolinate synthase